MDSWTKTKSRSTYRRRTPEDSVLYQIVSQYLEAFIQSWDELFSYKYGKFRQVVEESFKRYLDCGIIWKGCAKAECESCHHTIAIAYSCKLREICPSCAAKRGIVLAEHIKGSVLGEEPVEHVVFTIPKRLRFLFRVRKNLNIFFKSAWGALEKYYRSKHDKAVPGAILSVQCAGDGLKFHPHIHGIKLGGYFIEDGKFVEEILSEEDLYQVNQIFSQKMLKALVRKGLVEQELSDELQSYEHNGFNVWVGEQIESSDEERVKFLARYIERSPITNEGLQLSVSGDKVIVKSKNEYVPDGEYSPLEFLALLSLQVPDYYESTLRYFGALSYRVRGAKEKAAKERKEQELLAQLGITLARISHQIWVDSTDLAESANDLLIFRNCSTSVQLLPKN